MNLLHGYNKSREESLIPTVTHLETVGLVRRAIDLSEFLPVYRMGFNKDPRHSV